MARIKLCSRLIEKEKIWKLKTNLQNTKYRFELRLLLTLMWGMVINKRALKRNTFHCHDKVSFCTMDINVPWLAGPNSAEKFTKT